MTDREKLDLIHEFIIAYFDSDFPDTQEEIAYLNGAIDCILNVIGFGRGLPGSEKEGEPI